MAIPILLISLLRVAPSLATPLSGPFFLHESVPSAPQGFVHNGPAPDLAMINLRVNLVSNNMPGLEEKLFDVSNPKSSNYGKWLTKDEVIQFVTPPPDTVKVFQVFLQQQGIAAQKATEAGDWWNFTIPVKKANNLFSANYSSFTDQDTGKQVMRTLSYSLPASLKGHVSLVHPTVNFPQRVTNGKPRFAAPRVQIRLGSVNSTRALASISCDEAITPPCLQALYKLPSSPVSSSPNNTLAVSGFVEQFPQKRDLQLFLANFAPDVSSNASFGFSAVDGGKDPQSASEAGLEANLDIQYTVGLANGVSTTFVSVGLNTQDDDLEGDLDLINNLLSQDPVPSVLTTSYGRNENTISRDLAIKLCQAIMQLTARGTSVLYASGDGGVSGGQDEDCTDFVPTFPSGCPYVTSVGATTGITTETAADFSSGGFSNYFGTPSYQTTAVESYLKNLGTTNSGLFNSSGRGFPDVSAQGQSIVIVSGAEGQLIDGTSASSPIFASVVALVNANRISAGKPVLGFLNPLLYSSDVLTDITTGSNAGCGTNGFTAGAGWDPVTGLGTPDFDKLNSLP